ncbi:penicillin acylase family protein [Microbacterium nymphoidis]|uniref:penicillin acylase family protein n=1 Tax=Microbacterium nymphoidis TaxID=2898586 RepID=UPI001E289381|nr:penicillin acylase family protein [Microbacterium nymphoidis]MCD2498316.1 penicillin acylase family protein [Microbacterium nymphoidis]
MAKTPGGTRTRGRARIIVTRTLWILLAAVVAIIVVAGVLISWTIQRSFPQVRGEVQLSGLSAEVTVQRDAAGVPTITADTTDDLFFAEGFVHAQDRFWEMDFRRHTTSGRLSELFGESQVDTDKFLRTLGWHEIAEQEVAALDDTTRSYYESYAKGVNAYLAKHHGADVSLEYAVLGLQNPDYEIEPWTAADSVAWLKAMAWDLRTNIEDETDRAILAQDFTPEQIAELYPAYPFDQNPTIVPPLPEQKSTGAVRVPSVSDTGIEWSEVGTVIEAADALLGDPGEGIGSNSWVVAGEFTDTGLPLLANDPHLGAALPSVWYQVQLRCSTVSEECPFDVGGFSFSGLPGVVIGHNAQVAWGFTNLTTDVADLYIERLQGDQYWRDGALVPITEKQDVITVAGGADVPLTIRSTVHGPILSGLTGDFTSIAEHADIAGAPAGDAYAVSLRWTALQPGNTAKAIFVLNTAKDFDDFRAAASVFDVPGQNLIYADKENTIGYQAPGLQPIRGAGDGSVPAPGWDSSYDWTGYIPFDEMPMVKNPAQGFIVTANNAIVDDSYPYFLSQDWDHGYRAARITELITQTLAEGKMDASRMQEIQNDKQFWLGPQLASAIADLPIDRKGPQAAVALLGEWDAQNSIDSPAAAYANVLWDTLGTALFRDHEPAPAPVSGQGRMFQVVSTLLEQPDSPWWVDPVSGATGRDAVLTAVANRAYDRLAALQGEDVTKWNWGSLHAITLTSATFGKSGIAPIEWLFNRGPYAVGGGSSVVDATGWNLGSSFATTSVPSMRMVLDVSDFDKSTWIHLTGASGHAFHPNYVDQTPDWSVGVQRPWAFSSDAVAAAATDTLILRP